MWFAIALVLVLVFSAAYLFYQWYTDDLAEPEMEEEIEGEPR